MTRILRDADQIIDQQDSPTANAPFHLETPASEPEILVGYLPILDVARGIPAGYQALLMPGGTPTSTLVDPTVDIIRAALAAFSSLPPNTFIAIPVPLARLGDHDVRATFRQHGDLAGIVLDITDFSPSISSATEAALDEVRAAGALLSVGGRETAQPELGSIIRLRPSIVRLGRDWIADLDQSPTKRTAIEVTGRLTAQLDAWILAESVSSAAELRALAELAVPLAQGPFIGAPNPHWPAIGDRAKDALPSTPAIPDGTLRPLIQQAYTTHHQDAAQEILPSTSGYQTVVVIDDTSRPVSLLSRGTFGRWEPTPILTVNVDTPVADAVSRAMNRSAETRFLPLACTDPAGRFVGILKIEDLIAELTTQQTSA